MISCVYNYTSKVSFVHVFKVWAMLVIVVNKVNMLCSTTQVCLCVKSNL